MSTPRRFVVGIDGSSPSRHALRWAGDLAAAVDGDVVAVHVLGLLGHRPATPDGGHASEADRRVEAGDQLERWCEPLRRDGVRVRSVVVDGTPAVALLSVVADEGGDAVVVGPRGTGAGTGLHLGSTSHDLVARSPVPVIVVPEPD